MRSLDIIKLHEVSKIEIYLNKYSLYEKAKILYNHIYFGNLNEEYRNYIFKDKNYFKIIKHDNYNPRLIEFFTKKVHINKISPENYLDFVLNNLDNPDEIWRNSYENQIDDEERFLLNSLLTLKGNTSLKILEYTYNARIESEIINYGYKVKNDSFNKAIKNLEGSYLNTSFNGTNNLTSIYFVNPSISDFLLNYLKKSNSEKLRLLEGITLIEQVMNIFHPHMKNYINFNINEGRKYYKILIKNEEKFRKTFSSIVFELKFLKTLLSLFGNVIDDQNVIKLFRKLKFKEIDYSYVNDYIYILERVCNIEQLNEFVVENWNSIILDLFKLIDNTSDYNKVYNLFEFYSQSYEDFINKNKEEISDILINLLVEDIQQSIIDNVSEFEFEFDLDYFKVRPQNSYEETNPYKLIENIDEIIEAELDEYLDQDFLFNGPYITHYDLNIDTFYLVEELERLYLEEKINSTDAYFDDSSEGTTTPIYSDLDKINDLFSK